MVDGVKTGHRGLVAGITVGGAILSFTCSADTLPPAQQSFDANTLPIAQRIEQFREKVRVSVPTFVVDAQAEKADKLVQFFNFFNCIRGAWRNC
jgi:hypothetical protein